MLLLLLACKAGEKGACVDVDAGGRDRVSGAPEIGPPALSVRPEPLLSPGDWYRFQVTTPNLQGDLLSFAGTPEYVPGNHNPYYVGTARLTGGTVTEISPAPVIPPSAWDAFSQHDPYVLYDSDQYVLYYQGRPDADSNPGVGRAFSSDGLTWTPDPANPVFANTENNGASHVSVLEKDGLIEMWYASYQGLAFAVSEDGGASFLPYCENPIMPPQQDGAVKAPDVRWNVDHYEMTFAVGEEAWKTAWATSYDGVTWARGDDLLVAGTQGWNDETVVNMQYVELEGVAGYLFAGVGSEASGIGFAEVIGAR